MADFTQVNNTWQVIKREGNHLTAATIVDEERSYTHKLSTTNTAEECDQEIEIRALIGLFSLT